MSEATKLVMVKEMWKHSDEGLRAEFAAMQTGFAFYAGNQWSAQDLAKLEREGRPALTINLILPIINLLSGIQRQGRQDVSAGCIGRCSQRRPEAAGGGLYAGASALPGYHRGRL